MQEYQLDRGSIPRGSTNTGCNNTLRKVKIWELTIIGLTTGALLFSGSGLAHAETTESADLPSGSIYNVSPTPSPEDVDLYDTDDMETIALLNEMAEGF